LFSSLIFSLVRKYNIYDCKFKLPPNDPGLSSEACSASPIASRMVSGTEAHSRHVLRAPWITATIVTREALNL
jgi:hypothetical protein